MTDETFTLTIHMVSSLDGIIARTDNSTSWFETKDHYDKGETITDEDAAAFLSGIDCYVMGAKTYEHALELSKTYGWAYGDKATIVLSHRNLPVVRPNVRLYSGDLNKLLSEELRPTYKKVWVAGGAMLCEDFIRLRLADEIRISILPVILGEGLRFLDQIRQEQALHLTKTTAYKNGMVELVYEVKK